MVIFAGRGKFSHGFTKPKEIKCTCNNKENCMYQRVLTVNSEFSLSGGNAAAVFSCTAIDTHVSGQHSGND